MSSLAPAAGQPARVAFSTFLMLNDNYLPGALVLGHALRRQNLGVPLIVLFTDGVSPRAAEALAEVFDHVVEVERIYVPHARRQERQDRPFYFTRIQVLRLGADGDLGFDLDRVVVLDADVLPLRNYAELLKLPAPAGVLNEHRSHLVETDDEGRFIVSPETLRTGTWKWHRLYADCPHGAPVPRCISDRPALDPSNMGFNGSLFMMAPSAAEYDSIRCDLERPEVQHLVGDLYDWPDMQYLTVRWSGHWHNVDIRFSTLSGYPHLNLLYGTHFAGFKPWYFHRGRTIERYARFPDFQLWFDTYVELVGEALPGLQRMRKLRRLLEDITALKRGGSRSATAGSHPRSRTKKRRAPSRRRGPS